MGAPDVGFLDFDAEGGSRPGDASQANGAWDTPTEALAAIGLRMGPFEVQGLLGMGSMAVVFSGRNVESGEPVAIKVLKRKAQVQARERFQREAAVMSRLRHHNVVGVRLCGILASRPFLVLERLGGSVRRLLREAATLPVDQAVRVAADALRGLTAVHELGVVHRDVKPENLLVAEDGTTKVADFGLAKLTERQGDELALTQDGHTVGTPMYMSPEQASGFDLQGQTDVYSLGLVLHEMLTGSVPSFGGTTLVESIQRRHEAAAPRVRQARPEVSADVDQALAVMLDPKPCARPTAAEACRLLELALTNLGHPAPPFRRASVAFLGAGRVRFLELGGTGAELILGRSARADVPVEDDRASRRHCALRMTPAGLVAQDLGSTNGSWLGKAKLGAEAAPVPSGSELRIADTPFRVLWAPARRRADGPLSMLWEGSLT